MMMQQDWIWGFLGGILIGLSALQLLLFNGRILGVSGIISGLANRNFAEASWRFMFLTGLFCGGLVIAIFYPEQLFNEYYSQTPTKLLVLGGFLVGIGTKLGGGCTSGHGVCGIGRFSVRSIAATLCFMSVAIAVVYVMRHVLKVGP